MIKLCKLEKVVLSVQNNAVNFLNGITSNTLDKPKNAFLDFHGKIVAVFDQCRIGEDQFFIVVEERCLDRLMQHLERYIKLSKVLVQKENYGVYYDLTGDYPCKEGEYAITQKPGKLIVTPNNLESNVAQEEFTFFRLKNNIPLQGVDYQNELLLNVNEEEHISYTKGCFLGQEFIAKVHNRSKPSWKLAVKAEDECSAEEKQKMTSKTVDPETKKTYGFVFIGNR